MKIASIDIGTNAIKSKVFNTSPTTIDFIEGIRSPIRLGAEVFGTGLLSNNKLNELIKTLVKYQNSFLKNNMQPVHLEIQPILKMLEDMLKIILIIL
jgi:exopolyphosphatase/guanosine-5'-triphosphate,3'-diphosphate pyrophosphatase